MSGPTEVTGADSHPARQRKWVWIKLAAAICVLSWISLAVGIAMNVGTGAMFVLATVAAVTTEGTIWLSALLLGVSVYQARRHLWDTIRPRSR